MNLTAIIGHFGKKATEIVERHQFHRMFQQNDESIDSFVSKLRGQAAKCNFVYTVNYSTGESDAQVVNSATKDISDEMIIYRIVVSIYDEPTRTKLLREPNLTLESAIDLIRTVEVAD